MKRLKNILSFNHFKLLIVFIFSYLYFKNYLLLTSFILLSIIYYSINKDKSIFVLLLCFVLINISFYNKNLPEINIGRVIEIKDNYIIVKNKNIKFIVYTDEEFEYDSIIEFDGTFYELNNTKGFYRYNHKDNLNKKGIYYYLKLDDYQVIKQYPTLRYLLHKSINKKKNKELLNRFIFNYGTSEYNEFLNLYGFSYYGIIFFFKKMFSYIFNEKSLKKIIYILYGLLMILYHCPFALIYHFLLELNPKNDYKWCIRCLMIILYKDICMSPIFIIPIFYSLFDLNEDNFKKLFMQSILSSLLFNSINLLFIICYSFVLVFRGFSWFYSIVVLIFDVGYEPLIYSYDLINKLYNIFNLDGSIIGFGLIPFIIICSFFRKKYIYSFITLLLFQIFGLFHPLAEITFINVGQGDSILIREPYNQNNILIDTGKKYEYNALSSYLNSKGINNINYLFITHHDEDHDGSMNEVINNFNVNNYCDHHFIEKRINNIYLYDLNEINSEDTNESSLVLYTEINNLRFLLMGDATKEVERIIINKYPNIECDILKLSHHGSNTSNSNIFLDKTKPRIGIISSGKYNLYHHPHIDVLDRLKRRNISYLDTKNEGDITILFFYKFSILITSNYHISILK